MSSSRKSREIPRRTLLKGAAAGALGLGLTGTRLHEAWAEEPATAPAMQTVTFGRTGRQVSVIGMGCGGLKPELGRLLGGAVKNGVTFIDTAWGYGGGQSEVAVGAFLKDHPDREKLFVNTKASGFRPPRGTSKEVYEAFKAAVQQSLGRLQTGYVDCLMWPHGAESPQQLNHPAMHDAMRKLKEEGLVRHFGMSSHKNYAATCEAAVEGGFYDVILTVINVCTTNPDHAGSGSRRGIDDVRPLLKKAKAKNVAVMAMKAANPGYLPEGTDGLLARVFPGESEFSRHQKLYTYSLGQEGVHVVVIGMTQAVHVLEGVKVGQA